jgi:hypothetical protein
MDGAGAFRAAVRVEANYRETGEHRNSEERGKLQFGPLQGWIMARRAAILFIRLACEAIKVSKLQADGGPSRS